MFTPCPLCLHQLDALHCCPNCRGIFQAVNDDVLVEAVDRRLQARAADQLAAVVDTLVYRGRLDPRSQLSDARLNYGDPFSLEEVERLLRHVPRRKVLASATVEVELHIVSCEDGGRETILYKTAADSFGAQGLPLLEHLPKSIAETCQDGSQLSVSIRLLATDMESED